VVAAAVAAVTLGAPSRADAGFKLTISDGSNSVQVDDNVVYGIPPAGFANDLDPAAGQVIFSGVIGVFNINITTGTSNAPGTPTLAQLTINNTSITSAGFTGSKTLTFTLEDTGFTAPTGSGLFLISQLANTQLPSGSTVGYQSFLNGTGGTALSLNTVGGASASNAVSISTTPYTLKTVATVTVTGTGGAQTVQFNGLTAVVVPAPASLLLALSAVPALGLGRLFRRKKAAS